MTKLSPIIGFTEPGRAAPSSDALIHDDRQTRAVADAHPEPLARADVDWQRAAIRRLLGTRHFFARQGAKK